MIEQVRTLLEKQGFTHAAIIDDAYDTVPRPEDIDEEAWNRFFDDMSGLEEDAIEKSYGPDKYRDTPIDELTRDRVFVSALWDKRAELTTAKGLFAQFERDTVLKRNKLVPLEELLKDGLGMKLTTVGRDESPELQGAQLIFLDLFLGVKEVKESVDRAIARVKAIVRTHLDRPYTVVLMSASDFLPSLGTRVRDEAGLLGCQFRMIHKNDLSDRVEVSSQLYELVVSFPDAQKINTLINAWCVALDRAKEQFVASVRTLDLPDYASVNDLILKTERELLGDYVLDLYDVHMHGLLEAQEDVIRAAKALNDINLAPYPPAHLTPSPELLSLMDSAIFRSESFTKVLYAMDNDPTNVQLGDVFLSPAQLPSTPSSGDAAKSESLTLTRDAYVVLSQPCDLQHGGTDRILLLRGSASSYGWSHLGEDFSTPRTPVMKVGQKRYTIEWDILTPETWLLSELKEKVKAGYCRVRQFRTPFALKLQQQFTSNLGRVGTMVTPPTYHRCDVKVFMRNRKNSARLIAESPTDDAVCLVGRERSKRNARLLLSNRFVKAIRSRLCEMDPAEFPAQEANALKAARSNPEFYRLLKSGLQLSWGMEGSKPLSAYQGFDLVQAFTRLENLTNGSEVKGSWKPIIMAVYPE